MKYASLIPQSGRSAYVPLAPGAEISRFVTDDALTRIGGGIIRFLEDTEIVWTLQYDEILFVLEGTLALTCDDHELVAHAGDTLSIRDGASVVYRGSAGTTVYYNLYPIDWESGE